MAMSYLVKVDDLSVSFDSQIVLSNVSLTLREEEIITIIGPNGAGKSTLVRAILGLIKITTGKVQLKSGMRIGYMPQKLTLGYLMPITVRRFLALALTTNFNKQQHNILVNLAVDRLLDMPLQNVSGGELQRILLARALLDMPDLLILDEPTQGVDITGQAELYNLINTVKTQYKCGILMVSHDLHLVMANTDAVLCLNKHICCLGHPAAVGKHPEFVKMFGLQIAKEIAFYQHSHDHKHSFGGDIIHDD
jgi:zinc transport system ATP-binding protein